MKTLAVFTALSLVSAPLADVPHNGDIMTVVYQNPAQLVAVDSVGSRDEPDGSHSILVFMMRLTDKGIVRTAGRMAIKCHAHQWRFLNLSLVDEDGKVLKTDPSPTPYEELDQHSIASSVFDFICENTPSAET